VRAPPEAKKIDIKIVMTGLAPGIVLMLSRSAGRMI
jgi:hypothetical protein